MAKCARCDGEVFWVQMAKPEGGVRNTALDYDKGNIAVRGTYGVRLSQDDLQKHVEGGGRVYREHPWFCGSFAAVERTPARRSHTRSARRSAGRRS